MSKLVDMWKSEMAKLSQKGQTLFSNGESLPSNAGCSQGEQTKESSNRLASAFDRVMPINSPVALYSEASVFMIVECFSP